MKASFPPKADNILSVPHQTQGHTSQGHRACCGRHHEDQEEKQFWSRDHMMYFLANQLSNTV